MRFTGRDRSLEVGVEADAMDVARATPARQLGQRRILGRGARRSIGEGDGWHLIDPVDAANSQFANSAGPVLLHDTHGAGGYRHAQPPIIRAAVA